MNFGVDVDACRPCHAVKLCHSAMRHEPGASLPHRHSDGITAMMKVASAIRPDLT
jgi:hypothetical protein